MINRNKNGFFANVVLATVVRFFGMKGSFNWAIKEMKKGKIVVRDGTFGGLKYRLSTDEQNRLQWDFHRKETEVKWESANFFVSDIMATDWVIYNWR